MAQPGVAAGAEAAHGKGGARRGTGTVGMASARGGLVSRALQPGLLKKRGEEHIKECRKQKEQRQRQGGVLGEERRQNICMMTRQGWQLATQRHLGDSCV